VRFDASLSNELPLTQAGYCRHCGRFEKLSLVHCPKKICQRKLTQEIDYESMCEALVWTSVFEDIGITVEAADGSCTLSDQLQLINKIRPYRSVEEIGKDSFQLQCYYITHMTFILSGWGAAVLRPTNLFLEELIFLHSNMDVVIKMKDPELVGEFIHALRILGCCQDDTAILRGTLFLLNLEQKLNCQGRYVAKSHTFYKRYHAAYCAIIGLTDFKLDKTRHIPVEWHPYFLSVSTKHV